MEKPKGPELIQRLVELTWKPKKIFLQTGAVIVAYFIILIFNAIAPASSQVAWLAKTIIFIGEFLAYFLILLAMTAVAKITLAEVREEEEISAGEAFGAACARIKDVFTAPLKIFAIFAGLVVFHGVIDLWGKIPFVGELCWMFAPVILFPLGVMMAAIIFTLFFGAMILPTIISMEKEGPVSELIDFLRKHVIKFVGHFIIVAVVAVVTFAILLWALQLSQGVSWTLLGDKYVYVQKHIPSFVQHAPGFERMGPLQIVLTRISHPTMAARQAVFSPKANRWTLYVAGFVFGVIMWIIHMGIWGLILVNVSVGGTLSYLGLTGGEESPEEAGKEEKKEEKPAEKKRPPRKPRKKKEEKPAGSAPPAENEKGEEAAK